MPQICIPELESVGSQGTYIFIHWQTCPWIGLTITCTGPMSRCNASWCHVMMASSCNTSPNETYTDHAPLLLIRYAGIFPMHDDRVQGSIWNSEIDFLFITWFVLRAVLTVVQSYCNQINGVRARKTYISEVRYLSDNNAKKFTNIREMVYKCW